MKIETEKIHLAPLDIQQIRLSGVLAGLKQSRRFPLSSEQMDWLELMSRSFSIEDIVRHYLTQQRLVSFLSLRDLIQMLLSENLILNPSIKDYFSDLVPEKEKGLFDKLASAFKAAEEPSGSVRDELREIPFFRSLAPDVFDLFVQNMRWVEAPPGISVCREGEMQRSLFVLLKGSASIFKKSPNHKKRKIASLAEGSVFGEVGFLLGEPRTADVVTDERSQIVRLKYEPHIFDAVIEKEKARHLQKRFWIIHSLLKSEIFKGLPPDCFDSLIFSGKVRSFALDSVICRQGDLGESCFVVVQGHLVVSKDGQSIRLLTQGDAFGEIALLNNRGRRSATVQAQTEVWVLEIHYQKFYELLSRNLELACEFERLASSRLQADSDRR